MIADFVSNLAKPTAIGLSICGAPLVNLRKR